MWLRCSRHSIKGEDQPSTHPSTESTALARVCVCQLNYHTHFTYKENKRNPTCNVMVWGRDSNPLLSQMLCASLDWEEILPVTPSGIA